MKDIIIYGAGGFGKEVACLIERINKANPTWKLIGYIDDGKASGTMISHYGMVLGNVDYLNDYQQEVDVVIAIGSPATVKKVYDNIHNPLVNFPNVIDSDFVIVDNESFKIGKGNIIQGRCFVSCDVEIGDFNMLNGSISMGHDVKLGNFNALMPALRISGEVKIGDQNLIGVGSIILQQIKIGNNVRLGAGSVLMTKPKDGCVYMGNPAKRFKF